MVTDHPLARQPYASMTVLGDLLLDPAARAVLDRDAPGHVARFTAPFGGRPLPPGFVNIFTPALMLKSRSDGAVIAVALDHDLAAVPITSAATVARCTRYDATPPELPARLPRPAILMFHKINGFRDRLSADCWSRKNRTAQTCRGFSGCLAPTLRPAFHGRRSPAVASNTDIPIVFSTGPN